MSMSEKIKKDYSDGRTKQSFQDSTDINKILLKASKGDAISHLAKHGAMYGDFTDVDDLLAAHSRLERGKAIFKQLPGEVRREFQNDVGKFYRYVNDPEHREKLGELLPGLTKPGNQLPAFAPRTPEGTPTATTQILDTTQDVTPEAPKVTTPEAAGTTTTTPT